MSEIIAKPLMPPTGMTADNLKSISAEEKRRLLAELLAKKAAQPQMHPLSFGQERLWFMEQMEGESEKATYNIIIALGLEGQLNVTALRESLNEIIRRHAVLRATFQIDKAGNPVAMVAPTLKIELPTVDMTGVSEEALQAYFTAQVDQPFDLQAGPLVRAQLLQCSANQQILLWVVHHSIFDGFSIAVWTRELATIYTALIHKRPSPLTELSLQYHDFARWQRQQASEGVIQQQLDYWQRQLAGAPPLLKLPTDYPRPVVQTTNGHTYRYLFSPALTKALKRLSQDAGVTLFTTLQSAFVILLARYSGQPDVVIGTAVTSRSQPQFESLIGFLVNTLALRQDLSDNPTFSTLLKRVQQTTRQAMIHQDLPFEKLVSALAPERNTSHAPITQVSISWTQSLMDPGAGFGELVAKPYPVDSTTAQRDLSLLLTEMEGTIASLWEYNTDLFAPATIERMVSHLVVLLESIVAHPDQPVLQLPMLADIEYRQLVHAWNDTAADYGQPQVIHVLFEQQVERTPDAIALVFADEQLSYAELNRRANQLAHHLLELGVQADTVIAVAMERSLEMIVSLLAILKAGGAYVPIDPTYPSERMSYMLTDSGTLILLTQSHLALGHEAKGYTKHVLAVDTMGAQLAAQSTQNPQTQTTVEHLAYVIYTSGSTGNPKGVAIEHRGLFNYLQWALATYGVSTGNGSLLHSSLAFDLTVTTIWSPLLAGSQIHILPESNSIDGLVESLRTLTNLSFVKLTPAHLQLINQQLQPEQFRSCAHALIIGGEALHRSIVEPWLEFAPDTRLINEYGPTETVVGCVIHTANQIDRDEWVKIGRPIANTQVYILDPYLVPVPAGVPGELYIGGAQLGRGYLNRPELTAERFIQHPELGRLYKTGDLCRWLSDGNPSAGSEHCIEYLGRTDFQVKIRGFRIELGEIESALLAQAGVREAVVVAREDKPGNKQLVAYVVGSGDPKPASDLLRNHLAQRLPEYMVPAAFVMLEAMPLTVNGKVDRAALPAPDYADTQTEFVAPRNAMEAALARLFAEVLHLPQIGIDDNFFHMGGDSILILQLVGRAAQQGYTVRVKDLFQHSTVAQLATAIRTMQYAGQHAGQPQILASQEVQLGDAPLLPIQRRFLDANHPEMHHSNQPFLLTVKQPIDPTQLKIVLKALLSHHDALRFQYDQNGSGWHQRYLAPQESIPLEIVDLQAVAPEDRPAAIEAIGTQTQATLNLLTGDLVRFVYFTTGEVDATGHRLLLAIHHLAMDGVSRRLLMEDLTTLLDGGQLPPKTSSYRDWGETLQAATQQGHFDAELRAWQADALDETAAAVLPLDEPNALNTMGGSHYVTLTLSQTQTEQLLRTLPRLHDVTLDATLLTALTETLAQWSGQPGLRILLESYGRQELFDTINLNRTVGWFTSIYPLLLPRAVGSAVQRIRATQAQLGRVTDGGISFGALHYFHPDAAIRQQFASLSNAPVMYNNFSQLASLDNSRFGAAPESPGQRVSASMQRNTLIDCDILVINQQLYINWRVSPQIHRENAEALLAAFEQQLNTLLAEALTANAKHTEAS